MMHISFYEPFFLIKSFPWSSGAVAPTTQHLPPDSTHGEIQSAKENHTSNGQKDPMHFVSPIPFASPSSGVDGSIVRFHINLLSAGIVFTRAFLVCLSGFVSGNACPLLTGNRAFFRNRVEKGRYMLLCAYGIKVKCKFMLRRSCSFVDKEILLNRIVFVSVLGYDVRNNNVFTRRRAKKGAKKHFCRKFGKSCLIESKNGCQTEKGI